MDTKAIELMEGHGFIVKIPIGGNTTNWIQRFRQISKITHTLFTTF